MRIRSVLLALVTLGVLVSGAALAQTRLVVGNISEAVNLDPRLVNDVYSFQRIYMIYEPLIAFETDLSHIPRLATDWSYSEDGSPTTPSYPYDPERARALLAEAVYADGFRVRLHVGSNQAARVQVAEVLQYEAAQVGVDIQINAEEFATMLPRVQIEPYDFDTYILGWAGNVDPDYALFPMFHSTGGSNYIGYSNPRFDELIELGRTLAPGSPEPIATYREAQDLLMSEVPYAFIINTEEIGLVQEWIEGWGVHPNPAVTFHDLHKVNKNR